MPEYFDADGNQVYPQKIHTICPIEFESEAKAAALDYMHHVEQAHDEVIENMLSVLLAPNGSGNPTHIYCERDGFCHQVRSEVAYIASLQLPYAASQGYAVGDSKEEMLSRFCCIIGDKAEILEYLELQEVG